MNGFENGLVHYWDVFPKSIKLSLEGEAPSIPLSIRGDPQGYVEFDSHDESIAYVDEDGRLWPGWRAGATVIVVTASSERESLRYVQVEIVDYGEGGSW